MIEGDSVKDNKVFMYKIYWKINRKNNLVATQTLSLIKRKSSSL